jgi:protein regulator of cytokinesis 1
MATEEVLLAHEMEKRQLQEDKASKQPVLSRLAKYFEILDEITQLEVRTCLHCNYQTWLMQPLKASANDPGRLTGKGQRGDPGRLLREEKLRKRIAKEKPKVEPAVAVCWSRCITDVLLVRSQLETDLLDLIPRWEQDMNRPFLVHGSRFVEDLSARVDVENANRGTSARVRQHPRIRVFRLLADPFCVF